MIRTMLKVNHDVDISTYSKLKSVLKQKNRGYKAVKAQILNVEQIREFLRSAPDSEYLAIKVSKKDSFSKD